MADDRRAGPVPRDLQDQQAADPGDDPWEVPPADATDDPDETDETDVPDTDVPDTDEAGTGRQGAPHAAGVHPEQPVPDESSG
ncbi:hypothetical protein [Streptomyces sp. GESEQ-35]|uniref:hypothetical protein n=1 Tax=Streptomyces sp. GESEQ-35 TaxID=2812657 RepID=UPI001B340321|nr:hypothetical protein [Streptomyces sp. GESEQ-35]